MTLLFGRLTQDFVAFTQLINEAQNGAPGAAEGVPVAAAHFRNSAAKNASYLVYIGACSYSSDLWPESQQEISLIGIGMFVCTYTFMNIWVYTGEVNAKRIRERYLKAILRQDIAFFDNVGPGEVATRIQTDTRMCSFSMLLGVFRLTDVIRSGSTRSIWESCIGSQFRRCFLHRFHTGVRKVLAPSFGINLNASGDWTCGGIYEQVCCKIQAVRIKDFCLPWGPHHWFPAIRLSLKHVAEGGSLAEEVISTVRTAQAFGSQEILTGLYDGRIGESLKAELKASIAHGIGLGVFFFVIYAGYGLGEFPPFHFVIRRRLI